MARRTTSLPHLALIAALVALAAWPVFVATATLFGLWWGEARQIDAWTLEPKRAMLGHFLDGWLRSLVVAAPLGLVAVADYLLLSRYRVTWLAGGVLLPLAGAALALVAYREPGTALPVLGASGFVLAVLYRLLEWLRRRVTGTSR